MINYIIRRLLLMVPTLLGVTAVVFFVMALAPGGFAGSLLNEGGVQTEGDEARRIRAYMMRRYGLDKPVIVQYGRWLNQVSPVGFINSSNVQISDEDREAVTDRYTQSDLIPASSRGAAVELVLSVARYEDRHVSEVGENFLVALSDGSMDWLMPYLGDVPRAEMLAAYKAVETGVDAGGKPLGGLKLAGLRTDLIDEMSFQASTMDRVLFSRPAFKAPDMGKSLRGRQVSQLLVESLPITLLLNVITIPVVYVLAIIIGIYSAKHRGKLLDVGSGGLLLALWCVPTIWAGVLLIGYFANKDFFKWFPTAGLHSLEADTMPYLPTWGVDGFQSGWLLDMMWHMVLPVLCLSYGSFAVLAKLARGALLENLSADYVRTARAKGVDERTVLFRHAFRNSVLPLITVVASILPMMFVGSVIVETIFSIQGMGKLSVEAAFMKDREVVMGVTLLGGILGLASYLFRDILYSLADPRVSYE
jgi:peptide/nickel transport system permease protein